MLYTSSEANKLLRRLNEEKSSLEHQESQSSTFVAALNEDIESIRPEYNYSEYQNKLNEIEAKIRKIKHAINLFNSSHKLPGFDMTIDEILIYIPQLTQKKNKLSNMSSRLPKTREVVRVSNIIEYTYANYDVEAAKNDYEKISDELSRAQTALDVFNNTEKFKIDI